MPPRSLGERRLVGDDVQGACQRVRSVEQRSRPVHNLQAADGIGRNQSDLGARPIRCLARRVEALTVDQHEQTRGVQTSQPRADTERSVADRRDVGYGRDRVPRGQRVRLADGVRRYRLDVQRNPSTFAQGARRGDGDLRLQAPQLQLHGDIHQIARFGDDDRACGF